MFSGSDEGKTVHLVWLRRMTQAHFQGVHDGIMANFMMEEESAALAPHFKNRNRYEVDFLSKVDAESFGEPFVYSPPIANDKIQVPVAWPTFLQQQDRGQLLNPVCEAVDVEPLNGHIRVGYPRAPRPTTGLPVAIEDASP